jgi:hypothetical protein
MMFVELPAGFPKIEAFARQEDGSIPAPPDLTSIGEKVYRACVSVARADLPGLRGSTQRRIPYAMWLDAQRDINTREEVVGWYYQKFDDTALDGTSRTKRALTPLFHTYVARFDSSLNSFGRLATNLRAIAKRCADRDVQTLRLGFLHKEFDFFNPQVVGGNVAKAFFTTSSALGVDRWFESIGLWGGFRNSLLGLHIYRCALLLPTRTFTSTSSIDALMLWTKGYGKGLSAELKGLVAEALLEPWLEVEPPAETKRKIGDFCVEILGDPRFDSFSWTKVNSAAKAVLLRWLTGRTLDAFFDVLRTTADSIWQYRQEFWTWYYRQGHITEAWAVLGPDAHRYVLKNYRGADLAYGLLAGQYDEGQSVLLMRMGDLLFCEWSHNGKLRAVEVASFDAPKLYKKSYDAADLRFDSLLFQSNTGHAHNGLPHLHSDRRWWQNTAAFFISKKLGVRR